MSKKDIEVEQLEQELRELTGLDPKKERTRWVKGRLHELYGDKFYRHAG